MRFKNILLLAVIFLVLGIFIYIEPSITGFVVQDRFLISNVKVSAEEFSEKIRVEQFDEHEIKFENALYYFTVGVDKEQEMNYIEIEFMVDSSQGEDIVLYVYGEEWKELEIEFIKQDGRYNYYKAKSEEFGLFAVVLKERVVKALGRNDLILFGLLPILAAILLFSALSYGFVRLVQKINYRAYLLFKKGFVGLSKFIFSFGIVVVILGLISVDKQGSVSGTSLIYYAVIPLLVLSLLSDVVLNLILYIHRLIKINRVYRFFRNSLWLFVFILVTIFSLLYMFVPELEGSLSMGEIIVYGLVPLVVMSFGAVIFLYLFYALARKIVHAI